MRIKTEETVFQICKWIAQLAGTLFIVIIAAFILGKVQLQYIVPETTNIFPILGVLIEMVGIVIAWNNELMGSILIFIGYSIFSLAAANFFAPPSYPIALISAVFFLITALGKQHLENIYQQL